MDIPPEETAKTAFDTTLAALKRGSCPVGSRIATTGLWRAGKKRSLTTRGSRLVVGYGK